MRIINDIVTFCHAQGGDEFQISITHSMEDGVTVMTVSCPIAGLRDDVIEGFDRDLNIPRQPEIEQNYWGLSGDSEGQGDLTLVGMMIDEARVGYKEGVLYIHVWRKN